MSELSRTQAEAGTDPVVLALLRNGIRFGPEVAAQAVIELVHAGRLRVEAGADERVEVTLVEPALVDGAGLPPWAKLVLERLEARAVPDRPTPLSVLTTYDGTEFEYWRRELDAALIRRAAQEGLIGRRLGPNGSLAMICGLTLAVAAGVGAVVAVVLRPSPGFAAALGTALFGFIVIGLTVGRLFDWRLTEVGRNSLRRFTEAQGTGSQDSDGAGVSLQNAVRRGVTPLPLDHVWSSHGGSWRAVGLGSRFGDTKRLPKAVVEAMPERSAIPCQVVKHWYVPGGREANPAHCCAFDDGASSFAWSFAIPQRTWENLAVGDLVMLDFSPRNHRLFDVQRLDVPRV